MLPKFFDRWKDLLLGELPDALSALKGNQDPHSFPPGTFQPISPYAGAVWPVGAGKGRLAPAGNGFPQTLAV